ncbi:hypothetical protein [Prevotella sp. E13-27]|uniref:hypothetical protein n=1 Tax=Prevotella sp. E13-27 TaxID=2938122 RepID=UPI00200A5636|nr:hypothetical protein [Prevotella sp. E13-27]MCK8623117.1 hypothetical protein [Prevotella sp. E13-27]
MKDFGVKEPGTMNHLLFSNLKDLFKSTDRLKELILRCFNNAYYICTIIPFEDFPETQVAEYEKLLLKDDPYDCEEVCAVSMAMVCKLLPASDTRWMPENSDLIEQIRYRFTHYQWMNSGARNSFEFMEEKHNTDVLIIPPSEFAPRDIVEAIEEFGNDQPHLLVQGIEYICERLACIDDLRRRMYGTDLAIAHLKGFLQETYADYCYDPKKKKFMSLGPGEGYDINYIDSMLNEINPIKEAIKYITEHYPTKEENTSQEETVETPQTLETEVLQKTIGKLESKHQERSTSETTQLQASIKELQNALNEEKAKNARLEEEKAILCEPVKELTATQNIRLAFALQLLHAAGLADFKSLKANRQLTKVAQLLSLLLDIRSTNKKNGPAHTCMKWLTFREYVTSTNTEQIIELNKLFAELDLSIALSLENPAV